MLTAAAATASTRSAAAAAAAAAGRACIPVVGFHGHRGGPTFTTMATSMPSPPPPPRRLPLDQRPLANPCTQRPAWASYEPLAAFPGQVARFACEADPAETLSFFDPDTATFTYLVIDRASNEAVIIDSVLKYDLVT
ncbi:hypothetical protein HK405_001900, partial [Cladochytrium tenue]